MRKKVLTKIVREVTSKLEVVHGTECTTMAQVMDIFSAKMDMQEEGIIIKDLQSLYYPSNRST